MERNCRKDLILRKQALTDVYKIDVIKDFPKFTGKHLYQILYLMSCMPPAYSFIAKETPMQMFSCKRCGFFKNTFLKELFPATSFDFSSA